jgi:hypothetical protein
VKQRCSVCGGRFGLIRHRYFTKQFCTGRCKERYLQNLVDLRRAALPDIQNGGAKDRFSEC